MTELLLIVGAVVAVVATVLVLMPLVSAALRLAAAWFFAPVPAPPGLARLASLTEQVIATRQAATSARQGRQQPPAELVLQLRAITGSSRRMSKPTV